MTDVKEQLICIKFCFKLHKMAEKTHQMLKEAFGDISLGQTQTYKCLSISRTDRCQSMMKMRSERLLTGTTTKNSKSARGYHRRMMTNNSCLQHCWDCHMECASKFCQISSTCSALQQNLFQGYWAMIKRNTALLSALSSRNRPKKTATLSPPLLVMNVGCLGTTLRWSSNRLSRGDWGKTSSTMSRQVAKYLLGPASWQCSGSHVAHSATVFGFY